MRRLCRGTSGLIVASVAADDFPIYHHLVGIFEPLWFNLILQVYRSLEVCSHASHHNLLIPIFSLVFVGPESPLVEYKILIPQLTHISREGDVGCDFHHVANGLQETMGKMPCESD